MAFKEIASLDADNVTPLGGLNRKTGKANPKSKEGYYLGNRKVESKKSKTGFALIHYFQTPKGTEGVWGKTDMDRKLASVTPGTMIRVSFDKMQATPNGEMYKYKVEVDSENTIEVATGSSGSADNYSSASNDDEDGGTSSYSAANEEEDEENNYEAEEAVQAAALNAAERKAKVQALLNKNKR